MTEPTTPLNDADQGGTFFMGELKNMELKQPLTYEQQIDRCINYHNLIISDRNKAKEILKKVNYYRLSAYGIGLKKKDDSEKYVDGVSLEQIYRIYCFDSKFKNILIHCVEQIEIQLRTQISYHMAIVYGAEGYVDRGNFEIKYTSEGADIHSRIISDFTKECARQRNIPFVKHHRRKYEGRFPIWVAVELFSFGNLASLYDIMKLEDRVAISALYNTRPQRLGSWILMLVEVRNICAHYTRLYNMPLKQTPYLYSEDRQYRTGKHNKIFPVLLAIKRMLRNNDLWKSTYTQIEAVIEEYQNDINLSFMGFPRNWKEVLSK